MPVEWELDINGTRRAVSAWGIEGLILRKVNMAADSLQFSRTAPFDATPLCAFRQTARLYQDGVQFFTGQRILTPVDATGVAEGQTYEFRGPWDFLDRNVFRLPWFAGATETSHIITTGTVGAVIKAVLDYAIGKDNTLFQYEQADLDALLAIPPSNETTGKRCAAVILDALQFAPDTVVWFDYSQLVPVLRFQRRALLEVANVRTGAPNVAGSLGPAVEVLRIIPRPDLQVPRVHLIFEEISTENGVQSLSAREEIAPAGAPWVDGELSDVIIVQGRNVTTVEGTIETETIVADETPAGLAWLISHIETLSDVRTDIIRIVPGSLTRMGSDGEPSLGYLREIIDGQAAEWMINPDDSPVEWQRETITVKVDYDTYFDESRGEETKLESHRNKTFVIHLVSTNAPEGETTYRTLETAEDGDVNPIGLAEYLYSSLNPLQYDARFTTVEQDVTGILTLGKVINLHGSLPEYAAMRALIQEVTYDIQNGTTDAICGPCRVLSINEILAILRSNRTRRRWTNPATQASGELSSSSRVTLGRGIANSNTIPGNTARSFLSIVDATNKVKLDPGTEVLDVVFGDKRVLVDASSTDWAAAPSAARVLTVRSVCVRVGTTTKSMLVIGGEPY